MDGANTRQCRPLPDGQGRNACATINLVVPLPNQGTDRRTTETAGTYQDRPGAARSLIGTAFGESSVNSTNFRSTRATSPTRGSSTLAMATRTTTTRTTSFAPAPSADRSETTEPELNFPKLVQAYFDCRRAKRNSHSALAFECHLERNLTELHDDLVGMRYRHGRSICFVVTHPKPREVWAAEFRDRVVHHALYNRIAQRFHAAFIADSCACIPGRGTLYAANRLEAKVRAITRNWTRPAHYLKCDIANFFVSIDKVVLRGLLERRIADPWWLWLADAVLMHDPRRDVQIQSTEALMALVPPHKRLLNQSPERGLPIGNLSSQFFANVLLDVLDQHVKHQIGAKHYVRYVDDMILLHESPQWLNGALADMTEFLPRELGLELNPRKTVLQPLARGVDFVGHVIKPYRRTMRRKTFNAALRSVATIPAGGVFETVNSYFGLMRQDKNSHHDRARMAAVALERGHAVDSKFTKAYRKKC